MAQFKCKPSSNLGQDFRNHFMRLGRGVSPNFQPRRVSLRLGWVDWGKLSQIQREGFQFIGHRDMSTFSRAP